MIELRNASLKRGVQTLFSNANLTIYPKNKVGITGENGAGKSSLFLLILNRLELDSGNFFLPENLSVAHVSQEITDQQLTAIQFVISGDQELFHTLQLLNDSNQNHDPIQISRLHQKMDELQGYAAESKASKLLSGLGFHQEQHQHLVSSFSGGWQMRLKLARALMARSDILLLDEPTNHLDLEAVYWLEDYLKNYQGTLLLISHDREFLNNTIDKIIHISNKQAILYNGNYASYEQQRAEQLSLQQASFEKQQREIKHIQSFVNRFKAKATKAKQAQSRIKALEKMEKIAPAHIDSVFNFEFSTPDRTPHTLIKLHEVYLGYDSTIILENLNRNIFISDRIGVLGANGEGKSTFIKFIAGELQQLKGECERHKHLKIAYFAQHQLDQLNADNSPFMHMQHLDRPAKEQDLRNYLGRFNFDIDKQDQNIATLSGGEKARLVLAMLVYKKPNLLLLDEPTNHLDINMRDALSIALQSYEGAMLLVSHDRHLIDSVCDDFILVRKKTITDFSGTLSDYRNTLKENLNENESLNNASVTTTSRKDQRRLEAERRKLLQPYTNKLKKLEATLTSLNSRKANLEDLLADNSIYESESKDRLKKLLFEQTEVNKNIETTEDDYFITLEKIEELNNNA